MSPDDLRTDGGLSITVEEFERLKQANSSTPPEQRQRCPECGGADPVRKSNRGNQSQKPGQYRCRRPGCYAHFDEPVTGYESAEAVVEDREEGQELVTDGGTSVDGKYQGEVLAKWKAQGGSRYELTAYRTVPKPLIVLFQVSVTGKYKVSETWVARDIYNTGRER